MKGKGCVTFWTLLAPPTHGLGSLLVDGPVGFVTVVLRGVVPLAIRPSFAGSTPHSKAGQRGIRPIACGEILRRFVSKEAVPSSLPTAPSGGHWSFRRG